VSEGIHPIVQHVEDVPRTEDGGQERTLLCDAIRRETHDVASFHFRDDQGTPFDHLPGQFLTFSLDVAGALVHRCYTISSSPMRSERISITVKRTPGGTVSNWLHDHLRVGDTVRACGPNGDFSCVRHPAQKYAFLSGGSGITPLMSMARYFDELQQDADILFVHAARTPRDIIFHDELLAMGRRHPRMRNVFFCEDPGGAREEICHPGRVGLQALTAVAPDLHEREVFCCGPAPFMAGIRDLLASAGHDGKAYHQESFTFEDLTQERAAPSQSDGPEAKSFSVHFSVGGRTVRCAPGQTVLEAARAAGIMLPSSCEKGICGTCKSHLSSGSVEMRHNGGIRQREIDQGKILACCSWPRSDLVVER
jgi:3-phenylpropionate/trans-cinnamate dioxygenase ferredoxin reductase subunit